MRARAVMLAAGLMAAASVSVASPAGAAVEPLCVGTEGTIVVCVEPLGSTYYTDCVYTGGPTCEEMSVVGPSISCTGRFGSVCYNNDQG